MARGSIKTLGPKRYLVRWEKPREKGEKRQQFEKVVEGTKKEAEAFLHEQQEEMKNPPAFVPSQITVAEAFHRCLAEREGNDLRARTVGAYRSLFNKYIEPVCGDMPLASVDRDCMQAVINRMKDRGLMPYTIQCQHGYLCGFFTWVVEKAGYLEETPVKNLTLPEVTSKTHGRVLSAAECIDLLDLLAGHDVWLPVYLGLYSGLRPGEIFALSWEDVDLGSNPAGAELSVNKTLHRVEPVPVFGPPKTRTSRRVVVVDPEVSEVLSALRDAAPVMYHNRFGPVDFRQVCARQDGRILSPKTALEELKRILKGTEFEGLKPHDLRHTHASLLLLDAEAMLVVSKRLGHAKIQTTVDLYGHLLPNSDGAAASRFGSLLRGAREVKECNQEKD